MGSGPCDRLVPSVAGEVVERPGLPLGCMTASVEAAYLEHPIAEEVTTTDREVTDIAVRLEAKPFFSDLAEGEADVWRWRPRTVLGALGQPSLATVSASL